MGPILSFADFLDMVRRRAGLILLLVILGCGLSVLVAGAQSHLYRSVEVIQVVQPKVAGDLARTTVEGSAARRLQSIEQRVMARDNVLEVISRYGLFTDDPSMTDNEKVDVLRTAVQIKSKAAAGEGRSGDGALSILTVKAEMRSALLAQRIAHEFARQTIDLSREGRLQQARETLAFFTAREETLRARVARIDEDMAAFRKANDLALPGTLNFRRDEIASINQELLSIARERIRIQRAADQVRQTARKATADRKIADFEEELGTLDAQTRLLEARKAELESSIQTSPQVERQIGAYERELEQVRAELNAAISARTEAEVGYRLETEGQGEQLTVIEPATVPDYPFTRSRRKLAIAGAFVSVIVALGVAFLAELRNPVMRTAAHMERDLGIKPVVSVPRMNTRIHRRGLLARIFGRRSTRRRRSRDAV
ncbi:DUF874 domain-containing protein [Antarcticimicrobium luteum]|uniref:DUF874 domain-containing protein n=1 Tax=Antarcticimicrobium luteum TaxID=2547397 RepID=A0A4R5USZ4_9RHOB|nr:DUF874 domain-containing protein [Antarcticimicrobium luteum]TDK42135.1 DUF874 domain-containing protein [Antarcticimicrobium luteum]